MEVKNQSETKESIDSQMFTAAKEGKLSLVVSLHKKGGNVNSAIMGASEGDRTPEKREILNWAFDNGACLLFSFYQPKNNVEYERTHNHFFSRVSMLKGPGDVAKGSFKT